MTCWQNRATSNISRLTYLLENGVHSDVRVFVGEEPGESFNAHRLILAMWSKPFDDKLYVPGEEVHELRIADCTPDVFEIAMKYMYKETFTVQSMADAMETYVFADKYGIEQLKKLCLKYINENLYPENIPVLYRMPELLDRLEIRPKCQTVLSEKTSAVLRCGRFLDSPKLMIEEMLQLDQLDVENEVELFEFVMNWARMECTRHNVDMREAIDSLLPHVRFLSMTIEEFYSSLACSEILTDSEIAAISSNLVKSGTRVLPSFCSLKNPRNLQRSFHLVENHICTFSDDRFNSVECTIRVMNEVMALKGVSVYAVLGGPIEDTTMPFSITKNSESIMSQAEYSYDHSIKLLKCMLLDPIVLHPSFEYTLSLKSDNEIFQKCCVPLSSCFIRRHRNLELIVTLRSPLGFTAPGRESIPEGCLHFHEIFYS